MRKYLFTGVFLFLFVIGAFAHSGKTDSAGGHYNHSTGEYHYHHGYPAHQHPEGICPYSSDNHTTESSGTSGSSAVSSSSSSSSAQYDPFTDESTEGSYEEAFNAGMEYYFAELLRTGDYDDLESVMDELYTDHYQDDYTPLTDINYVYFEAFSDGYYSAEWTLQEWIDENSVSPDELDSDELPQEYGDMIDYEESSDIENEDTIYDSYDVSDSTSKITSSGASSDEGFFSLLFSWILAFISYILVCCVISSVICAMGFLVRFLIGLFNKNNRP
mgnify:CR=1 FL=1